MNANDLTVVIPSRDRWDVLGRTLDGLRAQSVSGFEIIVVVDGDDQDPPDLGADVRVLRQGRHGPGVARNLGAREARTPLVLLLGDDMIPDRGLVEHHVAAHRREPAPEVGIVGHTDWHPEIASSRLLRWLDWSGTQFTYKGLAPGEDAGWTRFYASNLSLKRDFFLDAGGFDEDFHFLYEDTDCGWRLAQKGFVLRYVAEAITYHLHAYTWNRLVGRFDGIAQGEHLMAAKHPWFQPWFRQRCLDSLGAGRLTPFWPVAVDLVPERAGPLRRHAERKANAWWYQQLAPRYLNLYKGQDDLDELREYLGDRFDTWKLWHHAEVVDAEEEAAADEETFYRTSEMYLYDLTVFAMSPTKLPYRAAIASLVPPGAKLLDYGCGIGADGLRLLEQGYDVSFADFDNPSTRYLRWRLERRGIDAPVYDVDGELPGGFDAVYCFDVLEHIEDTEGFLQRLESQAPLVIVNLVAPMPGDTHLHKPLDIPALLARAERKGLVHYRRHHGRVHLVAYRSDGGRPSRWRSRLERLEGRARSKVRAGLDRLPPKVAGG